MSLRKKGHIFILAKVLQETKTLQKTDGEARSPFTWIKRLLLKKKFQKKNVSGLQTAENPVNRKRKQKADKMYARYRRDFQNIAEIEAEQALALYAQGQVIFVDVRDSDEQEISTLPRAITKADLLENPLRFTEQTVICYCTIGYRSGLFVKQHGQRFPQLRNLSGGLLLWLHAGGIMQKNDEESSHVHVYGPKWALQPEGYLPVYK